MRKKITHREYLNYYESNKNADDFLTNVEDVFGISKKEFVEICLYKYRKAAFRSWRVWAAHARNSVKCAEWRKDRKQKVK